MSLFRVMGSGQFHPRARQLLGGVVALLATATLVVGCAEPEAEPAPGYEGEPEMIAPVTTTLDELPGAEFDLTVGEFLYINTHEVAVDAFRGSVDQPEVAEFIAGYDNEDAEFNPGVEALSPGDAEVTLTNIETEESITFEVRVSR